MMLRSAATDAVLSWNLNKVADLFVSTARRVALWPVENRTGDRRAASVAGDRRSGGSLVERINAAQVSSLPAQSSASSEDASSSSEACPCVFLFGIIGGFAPLAIQGEITPAAFLCAMLGALIGLVFAYK